MKRRPRLERVISTSQPMSFLRQHRFKMDPQTETSWLQAFYQALTTQAGPPRSPL